MFSHLRTFTPLLPWRPRPSGRGGKATLKFLPWEKPRPPGRGVAGFAISIAMLLFFLLPLKGQTVDYCRNDSQCSTLGTPSRPYYCIYITGDTSQEGICMPIQRGTSCLTNADCTSPAACNTSTRLCGREEVPECPEGQVYYLEGRRCVSADIDPSCLGGGEQCRLAGGICQNNRCVYGEGEQCLSDQDCAGGLICATSWARKKCLPLGSEEAEDRGFAIPHLQIPIPTVQPFTEPTPKIGQLGITSEGEPELKIFIDVNFIGPYIVGMYQFLVGIAGIVAGIMIVWAGVKWLTSGGIPDRITDAKKKIGDAAIGLVLILGSYVLLYTVNPDLTFFKPLQVEYIEQELLEFPDSGDLNNDLTTDVFQNASNVGINCPRAGGQSAIREIARSFEGKIAYRWNGKGGPPPYSEKPDGAFAEYNSFCPSGKLCLDCSGFINLVLRCAGLRMEPPLGGIDFFLGPGGDTIKPENTDLSKNIVNGRELKPGDIVGYRSGDTIMTRSGTKVPETGHVVIYIGNGETADNRGTREGREGNAFKITKLTRWIGKLTRVRLLEAQP